jgi:hypothetical protein
MKNLGQVIKFAWSSVEKFRDDGGKFRTGRKFCMEWYGKILNKGKV